MKRKLVISIIVISLLFLVLNLYLKVYAKYVYVKSNNFFKIESADNIFPEINGRNYNVYDEKFSTDVKIEFSDNLKVKYAKYYFKAVLEEDYENNAGNEFESGIVFENSGFYKIEVLDLYDNKTEYTFIIDKEVDISEMNIESEDDLQINLNVNLKDYISGLEKAEIYLNDKLFKIYNYELKKLKESIEKVSILKSDINFYDEIYIVCYDVLGNVKKSEIVVLNKDKIYDLDDLYKFEYVVNSGKCVFENSTVLLMNNLELNLSDEGNWTPIYGFKGEFDGKKHSISNLYINADKEKIGFFGSSYGIIKNFTVSGKINSTSNVSAGICAENFGSIINCRSKVKIISSGSYVGGIAGMNFGIIEICRNNSSIKTTSNYAGGIVGYNFQNGIIRKCGSSGNISSNMYAGGICGFSLGSADIISIEQSYNMKNVEANSYAGGICGGTLGEINLIYLYNRGDISEVNNEGNNGGIVGSNNSFMTIKESYNIGNINSSVPNQIAPSEVKVWYSYYILGRENKSSIGTPKNEYLFKELLTNEVSVLYLLSKNTKDMWTIEYGHNDGYPMFLWQFQ